MKINGKAFAIPYQGATILSVFEQNNLPIKVDCRKGLCKSCVVKVALPDFDEQMETLACVEPAIDGMIIECESTSSVNVIPPEETKRVTTRKKVKTPPSDISKAHSKVLRILQQASEAAIDGEWEGCCDYGSELLHIASQFESNAQEIFFKGTNRDLFRDFTACLKGSGQQRCEDLARQLSQIKPDQ